ncbi:Dabb family protein [Marinilongibacter aquaticus]|uniref:Dabb family protein n=1 Tax=Marinilongibacter aquaticus TaxID=2975157 RepID=UPI0021BDE72C|nr:Dabb family protein [Marinilongibacter aquaticus]UBM60924.1 Dabb family protein [Marinilongibacter aquaticus]
MKNLNLFFLFLALAFTACNPAQESSTEESPAASIPVVSEIEDPFIHHVYFYLKNPESAEDKTKLLEGLEKLAKVSTIQKHFVGFPASTNRDVIEKGYAVSWLCFFKNIEEEEMYQKDPIHLKFVEDYSHLWEKVIVYDSVEE